MYKVLSSAVPAYRVHVQVHVRINMGTPKIPFTVRVRIPVIPVLVLIRRLHSHRDIIYMYKFECLNLFEVDGIPDGSCTWYGAY